jgi:hypothetical protein
MRHGECDMKMITRIHCHRLGNRSRDSWWDRSSCWTPLHMRTQRRGYIWSFGPAAAFSRFGISNVRHSRSFGFGY